MRSSGVLFLRNSRFFNHSGVSGTVVKVLTGGSLFIENCSLHNNTVILDHDSPFLYFNHLSPPSRQNNSVPLSLPRHLSFSVLFLFYFPFDCCSIFVSLSRSFCFFISSRFLSLSRYLVFFIFFIFSCESRQS